MKPLIAFLFTLSVGTAQISIDPESVRPLTRRDFEETAKFLHDVLKVFTILSEFKSFAVDPEPISAPPAEAVDPNKPRSFQYQGEDFDKVVRALAREAKINLVVAPGLNRRVTFRMGNKTPREMIEILCVAEQLKMDELRGVFYLKPADWLDKRRAEAITKSTKSMFDAYLAKGFTKSEAIELLVRFPKGFARGLDEAQVEQHTFSKTEKQTSRQSRPPTESPQGKKSVRSRKAEPEQRRAFEYAGEDLATVLRKLGQEANMDLFVHEEVNGTVTMRLEDKTVREVIDVLVQANSLVMDEVRGVYYVRSAASVIKQAAERTAHPAKLMFEAYRAQGLSREEALQLMTRLPGGASFRIGIPN